jgi:HEAT repeat protein
MPGHTAYPRCCRPWIMFVILGLAPCTTASAAPPPDAVQSLREVLNAPAVNPVERERALRRELQALVGIHDLRAAVALREWRDQDPDEQIAAVDRVQRGVVAHAFECAVRDVLRNGDSMSRLIVMDMLVRMTTSTRAVGTNASLVQVFAADLAELTSGGDLRTREAAARALSQINPDATVAVPVLSRLMESQDLRLQLAGADGLNYLMRVAAFLATRNHAPNMVEASRRDVVEVGREIVPAAARGMSHAEAEVRKRSAGAIAQTSEALRKLISTSRPNAVEDAVEFQRQLNRERADLWPLLETLRAQVPVLTRALSDGDAEVRVRARQALEDVTCPQVAFLEEATHTAWRPAESPSGVVDAAQAGMRGTVQRLADGLDDPDARARRAVIDVLETLGATAAPAAPALVRALSDSDPFVRWSAARTLGKISPTSAETAVPALVELLKDADLDLRVAAAAALERYGRAARTAVPGLIRMLQATDADLRVAVIHALGAIGSPEAAQALPGLTTAVGDPDPRVQQAAAEVLGELGPVAGDAVEPLRRALQTGAPKVQKAAGEALLKIMRPAK